MPDEFLEVTKPLVKMLWGEGYFTVPLPERGKKEFKLDMPAFERFDIVAMKWEGEELDVKGIECKIRAGDGIPQARTYQLCMPDVYIASKEEIDEKLAEKLNQYGIGYVQVSESSIKIALEPRRSPFFNRRFYEGEMLPRLITILSFHDFMIECLGMDREEILRKADLGVQKEHLWISNVKASDDVQWSSVWLDGTIRFGVNIEGAEVVRRTFHKRSEKEVKSFFDKLKKLPENFIVRFEDRCPGCPEEKLKPGMQHGPFKELKWHEKWIKELSEDDLNFMAEKIQKYEYIEFGVWAEICRKEEIHSWTRKELLIRMKRHKERLDEIMTFFR